MPGNSFGKMFRIMTFGESHGVAVGVVIDGVPAGLPISPSDIEYELGFRRPGSIYTSQRAESDRVEILSGVFNGRSTGMPIAVIVRNVDVDSSYYEEIRYTPRPGHADLPYILRYGLENWDYRGGGRASGRETVARVVASAIAKKLLLLLDTWIAGCIRSLGTIVIGSETNFENALRSRCSPVRPCDASYDKAFRDLIERVARSGDSIGAVVEVIVKNPPVGIGEPVFDKIKADLAKAVMSIPGVVGFEIGLGFEYARRFGSEVMDEIIVKDGRVRWRYNYAGGILGGITTGEPIVFRCAFKPTSSINSRPYKTIDIRTMERKEIVIRGRYDPCIAIRGVSVVESMTAIVLVDHAIRSGLIPPVRLSERDVSIIEDRWRRYREICMHMEGSQ